MGKKPIRQEAYINWRRHVSQKSELCSYPKRGTGCWHITATETAIRNNKLPETEAEQIRLKVSAVLSNAKASAYNINTQEKRALASLARDKDITILPADKGRCTVVLNTTDYDTKILNLLDDTKTYEKLKRDPTSSYKKKVIYLLQKLKKKQVIDNPLDYRLYPGE